MHLLCWIAGECPRADGPAPTFGGHSPASFEGSVMESFKSFELVWSPDAMFYKYPSPDPVYLRLIAKDNLFRTVAAFQPSR